MANVGDSGGDGDREQWQTQTVNTTVNVGSGGEPELDNGFGEFCIACFLSLGFVTLQYLLLFTLLFPASLTHKYAFGPHWATLGLKMVALGQINLERNVSR